MLLNRHNLDLLNFAATGDIRPVLSGIYATPTHSVATNAYVMVEVETPKVSDPPEALRGDAEPVIIPPDAVKKALRNVPKDATNSVLENVGVTTDGGKVTLTSTDAGTTDRVESFAIQGRFPDYETVFPEGEPTVRIKINADYLKDVATYFAKHAEGPHVYVELFGPLKPMVLRGTTHADQEIRALVMPLRDSQTF